MPVHIECLRYADNHIIGAIKLVVLISYHSYPVNAYKVCKVVAEQVPFLSVKSNLLTDSGIVADSSQGVNKVEHWFSVLIKDHERCVIEVSVANEILMHFRATKKTERDISLSEPIDSDSEGHPLTLMDVLAQEDTMADDLERRTALMRLGDYINECLEPRERQILCLRYGLGCAALTQWQVAERLNISRSYVSRLETRALEKLRHRYEQGR